MKLFRPLYLVLLVSCLPIGTFAQEQPLKFYEIIKDDSVKMYFTADGSFTERECADFIRYTRVDSAGNFNGYFRDIDRGDHLLCTGYYHHGNKNGYFEMFHGDGKTVRSRGSYVNNIPKGPWEYFYRSALPERTVLVTETDTLLMKFVDRDGELKVVDGNGEFKGFVAGNASISYNKFVAMGKVKDGKPDGKWTAAQGRITYCEEIFERGKLVKGIFPYAKLGAKKEYKNKSYLDTFFLNDHLYNLEGFSAMECPEDASFPGMYFMAYNPKFFSTHLRKRIDEIIQETLLTGDTTMYPVGEKTLSVQFDVNAIGKAENFVLLSLWGEQFLKVIESNIKGRVKFFLNYKTLYFRLSVQVNKDRTYKFKFRFSKME
jgi:hypothetical protein